MRLGKQSPLARQREQRREEREVPRTDPPYAAQPNQAGSLSRLATFERASVNSAAGQLPRTAGGIVAGVKLPAGTNMLSGWVLEATAQVDASVGANTWTVTIYVTRGGVKTSTGITVAVTGTTVTGTPGRYSLQPGDLITAEDAKSGALNAVGGVVDVWGRLEWQPAAVMG